MNACTTQSVPTRPLQFTQWKHLPNWPQNDLSTAFNVFLQSCSILASRSGWTEICDKAAKFKATEQVNFQEFFETSFIPFQVNNPDGSIEGLITGYYEPLLRGSRSKHEPYLFPVYSPPDDLLTIDLSETYPELKNYRLRGRLINKKVIPYYSRAEMEQAKIRGKEIVWVDDAVELFFLEIQGSGRIILDTGETIRVGYADQNGQPYRSIGRYLVDKGELKLEEASMQGIKNWISTNPERSEELFNQNPSYVFFRENPNNNQGPVGALGVALIAGRSIAVDPSIIPLGAPIFLTTSWPNSTQPLQRIMLAQDTGGAIRGAVRADIFWGSGAEAAELAGKMRQTGKMWVLLPRGSTLLPNGQTK